MNEILQKLGEMWIVHVAKLHDASDAVALSKALIEGDLPAAEITFRTDAAEEAIRILTRESPEILTGAGNVLTTDQVERAAAAGARFIVSPGFNTKVVDYCISKGVPVVPWVSSATEIEMGIERGLEVLKFFPAEAAGGLNFLKAIAGPFAGVKFVPTGGIEPT